MANSARPIILLIIHFSFMSSVLIYVGLIFADILGTSAAAKPGEPMPLPVMILGGIALGMLIMGLTWNLWGGYGAKLEEAKDPATFLTLAMREMIVRDAFFETIGVFGFIGQLFGMGKNMGLAFCGAAFFALSSTVPGILGRMRQYQELAARANKS